MAIAGREVCIKTGSVTYCKSSPIKDCSCERQEDFEDPFYLKPEPETFDSPGMLLREVERVLGVWEKSQRRSGDVEKLLILWKITQLLMLKEVDSGEPFIITVL